MLVLAGHEFGCEGTLAAFSPTGMRLPLVVGKDGEIAVTLVPQGCPGDCNADGTVAIAELIRGVSIALGTTPATECPAFDGDGNGSISIAELIAAVRAALSGCPGRKPFGNRNTRRSGHS